MASTRRRTGISFFHADNLSFLIAQLRQRWAMYCRYCRVLPLDQFTALTFILSIKGLLHLQSSSGNTERGIVHGGASEQPRPGVLSLRPCYFTPLSSLCRTFPPGLSASSCQKRDGAKIQARLFVSCRSDSTCSGRSCGLATGCVFTAERAFLFVILSTVGLEERRAWVRAKYECLDW